MRGASQGAVRPVARGRKARALRGPPGSRALPLACRGMTVLVDRPIWPSRGRRWAHLVSDGSLAELHAFADRLGLRRAWFQGDHYDVPEDVRVEAIAMGAVPVSSTELVRRLRASGLRDGSRVPRLAGEGSGGRRQVGGAAAAYADGRTGG